MKKTILFITALLIIVLVRSCIFSSLNTLNTNKTISPTDKYTEILEDPTETVLTPPFYSEGFDGDLHNWEIVHYTNKNNNIYEEKTSSNLENGNLRFNINIPETYIYFFNTQYNYDDVRLDLTFTSYGKNLNYISLICRRDPYQGWYEFLVSGAGQIAVLRYSNVDDFILFDVGASRYMHPTGQENIITAMCKRDSLTLLVNGVEWRTFQDKTISRGQVGFSTGSEKIYPVDIIIHSFTVSRLPETTYSIANNEIAGLILPTNCTDWWDCASKTARPDDPRFYGWSGVSGHGGNLNDPWWQKRAWKNENEWRTGRATIIWNYLCQIKGCPSAKDLSVWLLWQEGSVLLDDERGTEIMVKAFKYKFTKDTYYMYKEIYEADGITMEDLSFFTPMFNPEDDGDIFSILDWKAMTDKPAPIYFRLVDQWWDDIPFPIIGENYGVVDHWWVEGEKTAGNWLIFYTAYNTDGFPVLTFGS